MASSGQMFESDILRAKELGHDGVIGLLGTMGVDNETEYAVFSPTQIKSAIGNVGTFDPENPDIRFAAARVDPVREEVAKLWPGVSVDMDVLKDGYGDPYWHLSSIVVPKGDRKQGVGSGVMEYLVSRADELSLTMTLTPSTDFGATSVSRLRRFYSRFGFRRNLGRYADHSVRGGMIRKAKEPSFAAARPNEEEDAKQRSAPTTQRMDSWLSDRQTDEEEAHARAKRHETQLIGAVGKKAHTQAYRDADQAVHLYIDLVQADAMGFDDQLEKYGSDLTEDQRRIYDLSQALPPKVQAIADEILAENTAIGEAALESGVIQTTVDAYSARLWKSKEPVSHAIPGTGKFTMKTPRARQRTLESILHGWSLGKELRITGALEAQRTASTQVAQVEHDRKLIDSGIKAGFLARNRVESDWVEVKYPTFRKWQWIGKAGEMEEQPDIASRDVRVDEEGNVFQNLPLYANPEVGKKLNNILGTSGLMDVPGIPALTKANAVIKHTILMTSLFHHQAFIRSFWFGAPLEDSVKALNLRKMMREGKNAHEAYTGEVRELVAGGLTIGRTQDWDEVLRLEKTEIGKRIDSVPMLGSVKKKLQEMSGRATNYLFHTLGPALKVQSALLEYRHLLKKYSKDLESGALTRHEVAGMAANVANDDFGGLNLQKKARNPTTQHLARLLLLAPDWTESNIASFVKAFKRGREGDVYRALWGRVALRAGLATTAFNLVMAAMDDDETFLEQQQAAWDEGRMRWLEADVTPIYRALGGKDPVRKYFSILGHFRDPLKWVAHPVRSAKHKGSVLSGFGLEALAGSDWAGRPFTSWSELLGTDDKGVYLTSGKGRTRGQPKGGKLGGQTVSWKSGEMPGPLDWDQMPSFGINQAKGMLPIPVQNAMAFLAGEMDAFDTITKSVGLMTSTTRPIDFEKEIASMRREIKRERDTSKREKMMQQIRKLMREHRKALVRLAEERLKR